MSACRSRTDPPLYAYSTIEPGLDEIRPRTVAHRIAGMVDEPVYVMGHRSGLTRPQLVAMCGERPDRYYGATGRRFWHFVADPSVVGLAVCRKCAQRRLT